MKPQNETFSSTVSGNAAAPAEAFSERAVPIDAVGQATRAMSARRRSSGVAGWEWTKEWPGPCSNTAGAIRRQVSQSMHVRST